MTEADLIAHWRKGSRDELQSAKLLRDGGQYAGALFHCHLAIEKALKAAIMEKTGEPHPKVHALYTLAVLVKQHWTAEEKDLLDSLSEFAVAARYDDPAWAQKQATPAMVTLWIQRTTDFLSSFLQ